jgi:hypothetical protein
MLRRSWRPPCTSSPATKAAGIPRARVIQQDIGQLRLGGEQHLLRDAETAIRDEYKHIADQSRCAWNARHDAEAARRRQQEDHMAAQFRGELDGLDEITGRS